ncbi:MAG: aminotransferase class I/II-fold pyridoxal phosphate-dependent enzyme [Deltaproteobacteria bacterium]|nr:MAG: aminotransferase class I/II-fold pyridoxal phosphate-dependent enzyme [Deltaproteobacteria bacterium]
MPRLSQRALALQESAIRKLDQRVAQQTGVRFFRVNIGQPDVPTPPPMLDAILSFQPEVIGYGPASGLPVTRKAAARYHAQWCPELRAEHVAVTTGGSEALLFAFTAICDPGDEILVLEPYYTNYNGFATVAGAQIRAVRTHLAQDFAIPSNEVLDAAVTERTRAIVFSNPANPTGAVYGRAEVERLATWAVQRGLFLIADEVYRRIWFHTPPASALELDEVCEHVVVIDSMSKTWSACGLRLGFLISRNTELMEKVERLGQARLGPQPLAQEVALAALDLPEAYYTQVRQTYQRRVEALTGTLSGVPGVTVPQPAGAFYSMIELPIDDSERFARWLVEDFRTAQGESVIVAPGPGFYADPSQGRHEVRLAAVLGAPLLERAGEVLAEALQVYPGRSSG